ncbi:MAG: DUF1349 domain-containing protein [Anaerolineae bacterium]
MNEPKQWSQQDEHTFSITADAKTDFWRVTRHNFIAENGHFYYQNIQGDFTADVKVTGEYNALYDQAGLMVYANALTWLKCGIEFLHGVQQASAVITREFSDWSIVPLPENPRSTWFRLDRIGPTVEVSYSPDGSTYTLIRQGYLTTDLSLRVGLLSAAPQGEGFTATYEGFSIKS